ncbi:MAG TPA: universal stress protein [Nitrosopumilaceae archaeon]|nr:universal stress protein [Nitrosopumilaceae archaeon]
MFAKILVAVDGSESSKKAFDKSVFLAQKCNSKLYVVHVVLDWEYGGDSAATFELIDELRSKGKELLERCKKQALQSNVQVAILLEQGDYSHEIIEVAKRKDCDLIIMGSRGMSPIKELMLGSVSLKVIHHASCPVMVVR